jgi:hypothetical protein
MFPPPRNIQHRRLDPRTRDHSTANTRTVKQIPSRKVNHPQTRQNLQVEYALRCSTVPTKKTERWGRTLPCRAGARHTSPTSVDQCARAGASAKMRHAINRCSLKNSTFLSRKILKRSPFKNPQLLQASSTHWPYFPCNRVLSQKRAEECRGREG